MKKQYILQIIIQNKELGLERLPCKPMAFKTEEDAKKHLSDLRQKYSILEAKLVYVEEIKL
jgi:hypothetical protein